MRDVLVIGGAGYVGQYLCQHLAAHGWSVVALTRPGTGFLLDRLGVTTLTEAAARGRRFSTVINLAYPNKTSPILGAGENRQIAKLVESLVEPDGTLVQFSTLAVFGFGLELPIRAQLVPPHRDVDYVTSKIEMERRLSHNLPGARLEILRLGNVWGPGSPNWVSGLVECLRGGRPLLVDGTTGPSNVTDVANISDYVDTILRAPGSEGVRVHHLAEFSQHPWGEFIHCLAKATGTKPVSVPSLPGRAQTALEEARAAATQIPLGTIARSLLSGRHWGTWGRGLIAHLPSSVIQKLKQAKGRPSYAPVADLSEEDLNLLTVLSCPREFRSETLPGWRPPINFTASLERVREWMCRAGY